MENEKYLSSLGLRFVGDADDHFAKALKKQMELPQGVTFMDLLKFLYQSSLGPFHLFEMMDETELKGWIRKNLEGAIAFDGPLTEELYGKKWVRLNFGPYKKRYGNDYQRIHAAFANVKRMKEGKSKEYADLLRKLVDSIRKGKIQPVTIEPRILSIVEKFLKECKKKDYPPIHHSEIYMLRNNSEYLVIPYPGFDETV